MAKTRQRKTRPCQPGDVLVDNCLDCGTYGEITVGEPDSHPTWGTVDEYSIPLYLKIYIPMGNYGYIMPFFRAGDVTVMEDKLRSDWGNRTSDDKFRFRSKIINCTHIPDGVATLTTVMNEELAKIQSVVDAHCASVELYEQKLNKIYESWHVDA